MSSDVRRIDPGELSGTRSREELEAVDLRTDLAGIALPDPILTASGCFASGAEIDRFFDVSDLAAVVVK